MSINGSDGEDTSNHTDAYYEEVASQEEIYLEEREEEVRAILTLDEPSPTPNSRAESLDEQRVEAAEELIAGDSDDPPMSKEAIQELLRMN